MNEYRYRVVQTGPIFGLSDGFQVLRNYGTREDAEQALAEELASEAAWNDRYHSRTHAESDCPCKCGKCVRSEIAAEATSPFADSGDYVPYYVRICG